MAAAVVVVVVRGKEHSGDAIWMMGLKRRSNN
jgi:hypothetical protein